MNIFVEHDAGTLARLTGADRPACDGLILQHGNPGVVLAATVRGNVLASDWMIDAEMPGDRIVCWAGTLGESEFAAHPPNWMGAGREAINAFCAEMTPQLVKHGRTMCFQPHSRHVLSDAPSCLSFLRAHQGQPFEIAFSPATMLELSMLDDLDDHLIRMFETLGATCAMVMLGDLNPNEDEDREPARQSVPLGEGNLPRDLVRRLLRDHVPPETPLVLSPRQLNRQLEWLGDVGES